MTRQTVHRILELCVGLPLLLFGGSCILADFQMYLWVQEDPANRHAWIGIATMIGVLPFLTGLWLVVMAIKRMFWPRKPASDG